MTINTINNFPVAAPPQWSELKDGRKHGVLPLSTGVDEAAAKRLYEALKAYLPGVEIAPTLITHPKDGSTRYALKLTTQLEDPYALLDHLAEQGLLDATVPGELRTKETALREERLNAPPKGISRLLPGVAREPLRQWSDAALDTPTKRYNASILAYMIGDVLGLGVGAANKDWNDVRFGLFSFAGTVAGVVGKGRHQGVTEAERVLTEMGEDFTRNHQQADVPSLTTSRPETPGGKALDLVERSAFPGFWTMNSIGGANLLRAGLNQQDPFKTFSGAILTTGQLAVLLKRQEGRKGVVDFEQIGEQTGLTQLVEKVAETAPAKAVIAAGEKLGINSRLSHFWEEFHADPRKMAGKLFVTHSANMWLVSIFAWMRGPSEMRQLRAQYGAEHESGGITETIGGALTSLIRLVRPGKQHEPLESPQRFHPAEGKGGQYWWNLPQDKIDAHIEGLKERKDISPAELERFGKDVHRYFQRQRLLRGAVLNAGMNAMYSFGNTVIGSSSDHTRTDLAELFSDTALRLMAVPEAQRATALEEVASYLAHRPEVWEHPDIKNASLIQSQGQGENRAHVRELVKTAVIENAERLAHGPLAFLATQQPAASVSTEARQA